MLHPLSRPMSSWQKGPSSLSRSIVSRRLWKQKMKVTITPSAARGIIEAPPSKSMAHRLLICAGLAEGTSVITNVDLSRDIEATISCLRALGARIEYERGCVTVRGTGLAGLTSRSPQSGAAEGTGQAGLTGPGPQTGTVLPCGESGSTLRFLIPVCLLRGQESRLTGSTTLLTRPLQVYEDICRNQRLTFEKGQNNLLVGGRLAAGEYVLPGNVSSQFVSGLLFALPLLEGDSEIRLIPPVESRPYIDMTLQALRQFGVRADWAKDGVLRIPGGRKYQPQAGLRVEGDYSNAAFFEALGLLNEETGADKTGLQGTLEGQSETVGQYPPGTGRAQSPKFTIGEGTVQVTGLAKDSLQGDRVYQTYLRQLCDGFAEIDLSDCPDLGPVLMAFAAARHGARFTGTRRLKIKESDRGTAMQQELAKMGVRVGMSENEITVFAGLHPPREILCGHNDHRIVMAMSILLTRTGGTIDGAEAVSKSLPDFFERMKKLGVHVTSD